MLITETEIEAARSAAETAARDLADAERLLGGREISNDAANDIAPRIVRARATEARLKDLLVQRSAQELALTERGEREQAAASALSALADQLGTAKARLVADVARAQAALIRAVESAAAYDGEVADAIAKAKRLGLRLSDVDEQADHDTGAEDRAVRVRGAFWRRIDPAAVEPWLSARVHRTVFGLTSLRGAQSRNLRGVAELDGLLATVPAPVSTLKPPQRGPMPQRYRDEPDSGGQVPFLLRAARDRLANPRPGPGDAA